MSWAGVKGRAEGSGAGAGGSGLCFAPQMAQELGISEKSPDYRNPFKADHSEVRQPSCVGPPRPLMAGGNSSGILVGCAPWGDALGDAKLQLHSATK